MVEAADLLIAEASFPSTGLGIELQVAQAKGIPIILCFRDFGDNKASPVEYDNPDHQRHWLQIGEGFVSLMALGMPAVARVVRYRDSLDGVRQLISASREIAEDPERAAAGTNAQFDY